jgi:DNA-binding MarR family transcriptional regulator
VPHDHVHEVLEQWRGELPRLDRAPMAVVGRISRLAQLLQDAVEPVFASYGLNGGEFDVLAALRRAGEPYERAPGELARHTMVTTGAMTKRIDRLELAGLVTRRRSGTDGRGRVVALTEAGRRLIDDAFTDHMRNEHRLLAALPAGQAAQLEAILTTWLAAFES